MTLGFVMAAIAIFAPVVVAVAFAAELAVVKITARRERRLRSYQK